MINLGDKKIKKIYLGLKEVSKIYYGTKKVYPNYSLSLSTSELLFVASGESKELTINVEDYQEWSLTIPAGFSASKTSGIGTSTVTITASNNVSTSAKSGTITVTSESLSKTCSLSQTAGTKVYSTPTVNLSYPDIQAKGGTVNPTISYSQTWTWNGVAGSGGTISNGGSLKYSGTLVNTTSGAVTGSSKGTSISNRTKVTTALVTVRLNNKTATNQTDVYQSGNYVTALSLSGGSLSYNKQLPAGATEAVPTASNMTITYKFSSGGSTTTAPSSTYGSIATSLQYSLGSVQNGFTAVNAQTGVLTATNRGTATGAARTSGVVTRTTYATWTPTSTYNTAGTIKTSGNLTATCTQQANNLERVAITTGGGVDNPYPTEFSAAGDAYVAAAWAYYTSNAKQEIQDATFDNWSISGSGFTMEEDPNFPYAVDIWAENRGTTVGPERSATISFEYSGKSDSITLTQQANAKTQTSVSIEIDHDFQDPLGYNNTNVPAAGGRVCIIGVRHYSYTSGATNQNEYDSFTLNSNQSWCVSDDASNLTISSRGTVTGSDRSATVYWQDGTFKSNEMAITQKANSVASYGIPTGRTLSVTDIPASGGTISSGTLGGTITQTRTFSSGDSDTITNPTVTSSSYSAGVYNGSLGNTVVPRTKIGTLTYSYVCNGKTGSVSADVYQQANSETTITYGVPVVSLSVSDIPASGGTMSSGTVTYTQTRVQNYTSGGTKGLSNVTSGGSISYSTAVSASSKGTTVSSRAKVGTLTATVTLNGQKGSGSADVYQEANTQYDKRTVLHFDNFAGPASKTVSAAGGQVYLSLEVVRGFTSGAEGNSVDVTNNALSSFSVSGTGFSISPNYKALLLVDNRGTTVGSERNGNVTGTWNGLTSPPIVCTQEANAVTNSNYNPRITAYGTPSISIGSGMTAAGGSATVSHSVTNTQTYNALYTSGSQGPNQTRSVAGTSTISITSNGNNAFSLSGNTLSHRDMATNLTTDSVTITAKNSGDASKTKTASTSITNSRRATGSSGGAITYGNVLAGAITNKTIPASGGSATATAGNGSQSWSKTAVITTYTYSSGDTKQETTTAASSGTNTISPSVSSITAQASSKGTAVSGQTTVKSQVVTWSGSGNKSASGTMYIYQAANSLKGYSNVLINQFLYSNIEYVGGTSSPIMDITYDITYDSGSVYEEHGLPPGYSRSFSISGSGFSINASTGVVTAQTNTNQSTRSATVTATIKNSSGAFVTSATAQITQAANPGPVDIYITTSFNYSNSTIQLNFSIAPKDTFWIKFMGYDQFGSVWEYTTGFAPSTDTSFQISVPGYNITDNFSIGGIGPTEWTISQENPYVTDNARYHWPGGFRMSASTLEEPADQGTSNNLGSDSNILDAEIISEENK